jgi:hypothetical protein
VRALGELHFFRDDGSGHILCGNFDKRPGCKQKSEQADRSHYIFPKPFHFFPFLTLIFNFDR